MLFEDYYPEFSAEYDIMRYNYQNNIIYPIEETESEEMERNL